LRHALSEQGHQQKPPGRRCNEQRIAGRIDGAAVMNGRSDLPLKDRAGESAV